MIFHTLSPEAPAREVWFAAGHSLGAGCHREKMGRRQRFCVVVTVKSSKIMQSTDPQRSSANAATSDSFSIGGWTVVSSKGPIMCSEEVQKSESLLGLKMPEMVFGTSALELHNADANATLRFDALHALSCVSLEPWLQVAGAEQWAGASALEVKESGKLGSDPAPSYDWTYSSPFPGALRPARHDWASISAAAPATESERGGCLAGSCATSQPMNVALLQPRDDCPILFHDEVLLYQVTVNDTNTDTNTNTAQQDELHDNGDSIFSIKFRCTPK